MKFAKLVDNIQISEPPIVINFEVYVNDYHKTWKWFNKEILVDFKNLLTPSIKECCLNQSKYFKNGSNKSSIEFINNSSIQVAYFFKNTTYSFNPCLIKCKKEKKFRPVNVSCTKLIACICKYVDQTSIAAKNEILVNELKKYLGKVPAEQSTISSYFEKAKTKNEVNLEASEKEFREPLSNLSGENDKSNIMQISNSYSIFTEQKDIQKMSPEGDCECLSQENRLSDCFIEKATKKTKVISNSSNLNEKNTRTEATKNTNDEENLSSYYENIVEIFGDEALEMETENKSAKSVDEVKENESIPSNSNKRKLTLSDSILEDCNNVLSELEKTDPAIEELIAKSKTVPNYKGRKIASVFTGDKLSQDSLVEPKKCIKSNKKIALRKKARNKIATNKMTMRNRKPQQSESKTSPLLKLFQSSTVINEKKTNTNNTTTDDKPMNLNISETTTDSDDDLPPAFDIDDECQPSREDILNNLNQLQKSKGKVNEELVKDDDEDLPVFPDYNICNNPSIPKESWQVLEETKTIGEIQNLTNEHLDYLMNHNKKYFREILKGKMHSHRHEDFIKGGKTRRDLLGQVFLSMYTDDQVEFILDKLLDTFCKDSPKLNDYVFKVLLTEVLIKIIMDCKDLKYEDAESMLFFARFS